VLVKDLIKDEQANELPVCIGRFKKLIKDHENKVMKNVNIIDTVKVARIKELTTTVNAVSPKEGGEKNRKIRNCNDAVKNVVENMSPGHKVGKS